MASGETRGGAREPVDVLKMDSAVAAQIAAAIASAQSANKFGSYIRAADSPSRDSFGFWRVSNRSSLWANNLEYNTFPLLWNEKITDNSGNAAVTHSATGGYASLTVEANDEIIRQSKSFLRYQSGKGQLIFASFVMGAGVSGLTQEVGYCDGSNGFLLRLSGTTLQFVRLSTAGDSRLTAGEEVVAQADWNVDKFDGTGPSGVTLDITKIQIVYIDFQALYAGRVRVGFDIGGQQYQAHEFNHANEIALPYIRTANLPIRYRIIADGTVAGAHTLIQDCSSVDSEGGRDVDLGIPFADGNRATTIAVTSRRPIYSIRPSATFNSITNRATILPSAFGAYSQDQDAYIELVYGGTLTNASFSALDATYHVIDRDVAATAITGGIVIGVGYAVASGPGASGGGLGANFNLLSRLPLALDIDGAHPTTPLTDIMTVVATSIPGTSTDVAGFIEGKQQR